MISRNHLALNFLSTTNDDYRVFSKLAPTLFWDPTHNVPVPFLHLILLSALWRCSSSFCSPQHRQVRPAFLSQQNHTWLVLDPVPSASHPADFVHYSVQFEQLQVFPLVKLDLPTRILK